MTSRRVALVVFVVYALFALVKLARNDFAASALLMAGERFCDPRAAPPSLVVHHEPDGDFGGYDAQFYYRFALDPTRAEKTAFGITVDIPPYRHQRILLPLLGWALSGGGRAPLVPWVFLFVDLAAMALLAWAAAELATPRWALAAATFPGLVIAFSRDLLEPLSIALVLAALVALRRERRVVAATLFSLAILTRETTLLVPAAVVLVEARARRWKEGAVAGGAPLLVFAGWQAVLTGLHGRVPALSNGGSLRPPFVGFVRFLGEAVRYVYVLDALQAVLLVAVIVVAARATRRSSVPPAEKVAWALYVLLATTYGERAYWSDPASYLRVSSELFALGAIVVAAAPAVAAARSTRAIYAAWAGLSGLYLVLASGKLR